MVVVLYPINHGAMNIQPQINHFGIDINRLLKYQAKKAKAKVEIILRNINGAIGDRRMKKGIPTKRPWSAPGI